MKKQYKSFAERARLLEKKYTKLAFDKLEQEEFEAEMTKLQQEQEAVREMMGMNQQEQPMQQFKNGGDMTPAYQKKNILNTPIYDMIINSTKSNTIDFGGGKFGGAGTGREWNASGDKMIERNWLDHRYPVGPTFDAAFGDARKKGLKEFTFAGKKYNTEMGDGSNWNKNAAMRPEAVLRMVTDERNKIIDDSTRVEPFLGIPPVLEIPAGTPNQKFAYGGKMKYDDGGPMSDETYNIYDTQYPSWMPDWATSTLDFLGNIDRLGMKNYPLTTGVAPVPGRGFKGGYKNFVQNIPRNIPKQTFSTAPNVIMSRPSVIPKNTSGDISNPFGLSNIYAGNKTPIPLTYTKEVANPWGNLTEGSLDPTGIFPGTGTKTLKVGKYLNKGTADSQAALDAALKKGAEQRAIMDELVNAPGGLSKSMMGQSTPFNATSVSKNVSIPWKNIGYGAAGIGGAGLLGAGIYGLTQLPDGRVVDKQGNPISQSQIDAMSGANPSISKVAGFEPTQEWLNSIGWNSKLPTEQQVKSNIKGGGKSGNKVIKQDLVQGTLLSPEQAAVGIETDIRNSNNFSPESLNFHPKQALNTGLEFDKLKTFASGQQTKADDMNKPGFWDKNKQYLPYAISGASNIASNLLLAAMAKKNQPRISPSLVSPEKINMEPQAEQMRKDASVSKNIGMRNARDLGLNAGATLANMGAIGSGVDRQLGSNLTNLYGQQEQYNVGTANQFALQNQEASNRANMVNAQFEQQANQDRLGYIGGALGTIPGVMKDIRMDKADAQMRDVMDRYYQSIGGRNYATVGSIFKDPKSGFKYKVKPDLTLEQVK